MRVVTGAEAHDVDLSHGGRKIAKKRGTGSSERSHFLILLKRCQCKLLFGMAAVSCSDCGLALKSESFSVAFT